MYISNWSKDPEKYYDLRDFSRSFVDIHKLQFIPEFRVQGLSKMTIFTII